MPSFIQSGLYHVTFKAFDGIDIDKEIVLIEVLEAGEQAPVFDSIPSPSVVEGDTLIGIVTGHDPDTLPVTITFDITTMPVFFAYVDSGNGVASFIFTPDYTQADTYYIDVIIDDGSLADTATMTVDVIEAGNQDPVLDSISDYTIGELNTLSFTVTASDADSTLPLLYTSLPLPGSAVFDSAYGSGQFNWTTTIDDSGTYAIMFYAQDSLYPTVIDSQLVTITVVDTNRAPWLFVPAQQDTLGENDTLYYRVIAWDDDGPTPTIEAFLSGEDTLATNMTFHDSANGSGFITFTPDYTQGDDDPTFYYVVFRACDSIEPTLCSETGSNPIRVYDVNQPPEMQFSAGTGPFDITEGDSLVFTVTADDPDGPAPTLSAENLPDSNATFELILYNYGTFSFYPDYLQAGQYLPRFIAVDSLGLADTQVVEINVAEAANQPPSFTTILPDTIEVFAGIQHDTTVQATDPELDSIVLAAVFTWPDANFVDHGDGTGTFTCIPDLGNVGSVYQVVFTATDNPGGAADTIITHYHVNSFARGDVDGNTKYTMNDIVFLISYLFRGGAAPTPIEAGDVDQSGAINVSDIAYLVNYLYNSGPRPPQ